MYNIESSIPDHAEERSAIRQFESGYMRLEADMLSGIFPAGYTLLSISDKDTEKSISDARAWVNSKNLSADDVKLMRYENSIYVITKREVYIAI